ncbi:DNA mismatch repair endonuclease MutL [Chloroflexota bacterium]
MMVIKLLDSKLVSLIAAGEVVERPASVVKELVENALDAGASQISIVADGDGTRLLQVVDNGFGIPSAELELAFNRHATSKINCLEDLDSISSLGFRGEALPSIASVSEIEITTRTAGETAGSYLKLNGGDVVEQGSRGHSQGTMITIRNLFREVPARLKFLKSAATENSHIVNVVSQYALAFPEVGFSLSIKGRNTLKTSGSGKLIDALSQIYGLEMAHNMLELGIESGFNPLAVSGMVGSPSVNRSNRNYLSFFVNRRWISSRMLAWAVEEAYHGLLMTGRHPLAVINISIPPDEVDVNIHPTKSEVKFRNERAVFSVVQKTVRQALLMTTPVPNIAEVSTSYGTRRASGLPLHIPQAAGSASFDMSLPATPSTPLLSLPVLRILGQLESTYIVAEGPDGLYLIDQHAAHERILFEEINSKRLEQKAESQGLLEPAIFEISSWQGEILDQYSAEVAEFGFALEPFGKRTYLVRAVPALLYRKDWAAMLRELLDLVSVKNGRDWREEIAISMACHSAIRAGQVLTDDEMREMIRQLEKTSLPNTCPHGRPTMIRLESARLKREFGRT